MCGGKPQHGTTRQRCGQKIQKGVTRSIAGRSTYCAQWRRHGGRRLGGGGGAAVIERALCKCNERDWE